VIEYDEQQLVGKQREGRAMLVVANHHQGLDGLLERLQRVPMNRYVPLEIEWPEAVSNCWVRQLHWCLILVL